MYTDYYKNKYQKKSDPTVTSSPTSNSLFPDISSCFLENDSNNKNKVVFPSFNSSTPVPSYRNTVLIPRRINPVSNSNVRPATPIQNPVVTLSKVFF